MLYINVIDFFKLKNNKKIKGLGKIKEIIVNKNIYHEKILIEILVKNASLEVLNKIVYIDSLNIVSVAYEFVLTEKAKEKFRKYDKKIFSKFRWLIASLGSNYSKLITENYD